MTGYNKDPEDLGVFSVEVEEYFSYTYLPIKLINSSELIIENRLKVFEKLIGRVCCDYIGEYGLDGYVNSYVYITAKHQYQKEYKGFNRAGWHSDGFMTDDISYIWSNTQPTVFNNSEFDITQDDILSMTEMVEQADPKNNFIYPNNSLLRMDQFSIHKVGNIIKGNRAFLKVVISKDKFDLQGNSKNYDLDYDWQMRLRKATRNIPQKLS